MDAHRIEFRGLPSPFADPVVNQRIATRQMSKSEHEAVWRMEQRRQKYGFCRYWGVTTHQYTPEDFERLRREQYDKGRTSVMSLAPLSRTYVWSPQNNYVTLVDVNDLHSLYGIHLAHAQAFVDLDAIVIAR